MNEVDVECGEDILDHQELYKLRQACATEIDKLKEAAKNPLMKYEIRAKCQERVVFGRGTLE